MHLTLKKINTYLSMELFMIFCDDSNRNEILNQFNALYDVLGDLVLQINFSDFFYNNENIIINTNIDKIGSSLGKEALNIFLKGLKELYHYIGILAYANKKNIIYIIKNNKLKCLEMVFEDSEKTTKDLIELDKNRIQLFYK